jgi:hypothetical protein
MPRVHSRSFHLLEVSRPSARSCHASNMFRPCRSSRLRRFAPHRHPAGLLHPAADHGVRPVFSFEPSKPASRMANSELSPETPNPSERSPRLQPHRVTAAVALSPFHILRFSPPVRCRTGIDSLCTQPTSRLCSTAESVASSGVSTKTPLDAPMGFVPLGFQQIRPRGTPKRPRSNRRAVLLERSAARTMIRAERLPRRTWMRLVENQSHTPPSSRRLALGAIDQLQEPRGCLDSVGRWSLVASADRNTEKRHCGLHFASESRSGLAGWSARCDPCLAHATPERFMVVASLARRANGPVESARA